MNRVLIGIHGKPRAGKDTLAQYLADKYCLVQYGPSYPVKRTAAAMFDVPEENFWKDDIKETVDPFWGISYREMAQKVGTESSRLIFGEDFWMRHVDKMWEHITSVSGELLGGMILADVRYANEIEWVRSKGGLVVFITRENRPTVINEDKHPVERGLALELADVVIPNNGTIEELYQKAEMIVEPLL